MSARLKVLHVETGANLYGGGLQVLYLLQRLDGGACTNVLVCARASALGAAAARSGVKTHELRLRGDLDLPAILRLHRIIRAERPDIVHLHSRRGADILGGVAARLAGVPAVLTRRVDNPEPRVLARLKYALYDRVIVISRAIERVLLDEGLAAEKIRCIHSAIDTVPYAADCDKTRFRRRFGIPEEHAICGTVAQLIARKGHRYLLEAVPEILRAHAAVSFVFFGKGPLEGALRAQSRRLGIESHVHFAGFRDDLAGTFGCLDVLIHPADMEGLGVALLQAAAAGVPIVASRAGGIPEVVRNEVNGYLVPPADPPAIARAVLRLLRDPRHARRLGAAGRRIAERRFSVDAMVRATLGLYREVIAARPDRHA